MRRRALGLALCALLLAAVSAGAQTAVVTTQSGNTKNQEATSVAATAVAVTLPASATARAHLYSLGARCSAGTAAVTISDGGTQIWSSSAGWVGTTTIGAAWIPGLTGGLNKAMVITLGTCGGGNTGTLAVQADIY